MTNPKKRIEKLLDQTHDIFIARDSAMFVESKNIEKINAMIQNILKLNNIDYIPNMIELNQIMKEKTGFKLLQSLSAIVNNPMRV